VKFDGSFKQRGKAFDIIVKQVRLTQGALNVRLDAPAQLAVTDEEVRIHKLRVAAGRGRIEIKGVASPKALNLDAVLSHVPAKIANTFVPSLGLDGSISGTATVRGTPAAPIATINTSWENAIARAMRETTFRP
jgi:translocation and assembly module TamB